MTTDQIVKIIESKTFPPKRPWIICKYKFHNPFVIERSLHICVVLYCVKMAGHSRVKVECFFCTDVWRCNTETLMV